jgi:hypothetical protein
LGEYDRAAFADRRIEAAGQGFEALSLVQMREKPLLKAPAESRPARSPQPNASTLSDTVNAFTKELAGDYKCPDAGYTLKVDYDSVKHAFWFGRGESKTDSGLALALRHLPQLIDSAVALEKNIPPSKHDKHKRASDMLWAPLVIDGRLYAVRMRVEHQPGGKRHLYHLEVENWSNPANRNLPPIYGTILNAWPVGPPVVRT